MLISALTLAAAAFAAWYARRAWLEAKRNADGSYLTLAHAEHVSRIELRPWVSVTISPKVIRKSFQGYDFAYDVICENLGKTVAKNFILNDTLRFEDLNIQNAIQFLWDKCRVTAKSSNRALMPGEVYIFSSWTKVSDKTIPCINVTGKVRTVTPIVIISVGYQSETGAEWHWTDCAYSISPIDGDVMRDWIIEEDGYRVADELRARPYSTNLAT